MTTALSFREHEGFQWAALRMTLAGALAGLLAWALFRPAWTAASFGVVAAAVAAAAVLPWARASGARWRGLLLLGLAIALPALGAVLLAALSPAEGAFGFSVLAGAALSVGLRGRRLALAIAGAAAAVGAALWVATQVLLAQELAALPGWSLAGLAGFGFSLVSVTALLPRHVEIRRDPVEAAFRELSGRSAGEVKELLVRAHALFRRASAELPEHDENRRLLEEAVLRLFDAARRLGAIGAEGSPDQSAELCARMTKLDERIAAARDEVVRKQYEQAQAALADQLRCLEEIATHRERVVARMHNYLALMERLRLAIVKLESADASREALGPIVSDLEELGQDIDSSAAALDAADRLA